MSHAHARPANPAPWAEIVPGMGPVTVDILLRLSDDGYIYEVVEGVLVRMAGSGDDATRLALRLGARLLAYVDEHDLGFVTGADGVYKFPGAETGLLPDAGFYSHERRALVVDGTKPIPFAPDLAAEVVSPSQDADDMAAKVRLYFAGGTRLVWIVWPRSKHIDVWRHGTRDQPEMTLHMGDTLEGEDVVPGFTCPLAALFR